MSIINIKRTDSNDDNFRKLVEQLDCELKIRDGEDHSFYNQFNKVDNIKHVVVAYKNDEPVGCGAIKKYSGDAMEVKRMFVAIDERGSGIASIILDELEKWSREMNYSKCVLETGTKQQEAIRLYEKNNYKRIPNYGQYAQVENSLCFEKGI